MKIGVFDSGVGGLSVLREIRKILPNESIYYVGDTGRVPYGNKSKDIILEYSREIVEFLMGKGVDIIVIACNTATIMAMNELKKEYNIPIVGVINGGVKTALNRSKTGKIGVLGTEATIKSREHEKKLKLENNGIEVFGVACPLLVYAVEEGLVEGRLLEEIIKMYLQGFVKEVDTVILGCTHYPLIKDIINKIYPNLYLVDPSETTALEVKTVLENKGINIENTEKGEIKFFVTGDEEKFREVGTMFLGEKIEMLKKIKF